MEPDQRRRELEALVHRVPQGRRLFPHGGLQVFDALGGQLVLLPHDAEPLAGDLQLAVPLLLGRPRRLQVHVAGVDVLPHLQLEAGDLFVGVAEFHVGVRDRARGLEAGEERHGDGKGEAAVDVLGIEGEEGAPVLAVHASVDVRAEREARPARGLLPLEGGLPHRQGGFAFFDLGIVPQRRGDEAVQVEAGRVEHLGLLFLHVQLADLGVADRPVEGQETLPVLASGPG